MEALPLAEGASDLAIEYPIDLVHLARATLGDAGLECEMLHAFACRAGALILRMKQTAGFSVSATAQALKGLARNIGAWRVVCAAETVELAAEIGAEGELKSAVDQLDVVTGETRTAIAELLGANWA
jgi:hypothetical protein